MALKLGEATSGQFFLFSLFFALLCAAFINCNANFSIGLELLYLDLNTLKDLMSSLQILNQIIYKIVIHFFNQINSFAKIENASSREKK